MIKKLSGFLFKIKKKITLIKNYISINKKLLKILFMSITVLIFTILIQNKILITKINVLEKNLDYEKNQRQVDIKLISEKVDAISKFIKRMYPKFDYSYKDAIDNAFNDTKLINELPEDLFSIYVNQKWIVPHGLSNYEKTLKKILWPLEETSGFTAGKNTEYGKYRPYEFYNNQHEGLDICTYFNNSVYAIFDAVVFKKYYSEGGGWTLEIKFKYEDPEGVYTWYFARFRHLEEIYVKVGDAVKKGAVIANMGNTGNFSTGKHLHFELWKWNGKRFVNINPVQNSTWENKIVEKIRY